MKRARNPRQQQRQQQRQRRKNRSVKLRLCTHVVVPLLLRISVPPAPPASSPSRGLRVALLLQLLLLLEALELARPPPSLGLPALLALLVHQRSPPKLDRTAPSPASRITSKALPLVLQVNRMTRHKVSFEHSSVHANFRRRNSDRAATRKKKRSASYDGVSHWAGSLFPARLARLLCHAATLAARITGGACAGAPSIACGWCIDARSGRSPIQRRRTLAAQRQRTGCIPQRRRPQRPQRWRRRGRGASSTA